MKRFHAFPKGISPKVNVLARKCVYLEVTVWQSQCAIRAPPLKTEFIPDAHKYLNKHQVRKHGVMVIVVGNGHGDTSSNPGRD